MLKTVKGRRFVWFTFDRLSGCKCNILLAIGTQYHDTYQLIQNRKYAYPVCVRASACVCVQDFKSGPTNLWLFRPHWIQRCPIHYTSISNIKFLTIACHYLDRQSCYMSEITFFFKDSRRIKSHRQDPVSQFVKLFIATPYKTELYRNMDKIFFGKQASINLVHFGPYCPQISQTDYDFSSKYGSILANKSNWFPIHQLGRTTPRRW